MDIIVEGKASDFFKPDQINLNINFYTKKDAYNLALNCGTNNVENFIKNVIEVLEFNKEDLKTRSFSVTEVTRYDSEKRQHLKDGFAYSQNSNLKFDYDAEKLSKFMELVSTLENPPIYRINFELKNEESAKSLVIAKAYAKAEEKAKMIALAAGKKLKNCIKVDFKPFDERVISNTEFNDTFKMEKCMSASIAQTIQNTFNPEDIEVQEKLYCLWIAE